ncbi:MAG: SBBP repeat-containing protein [Ignavibacteriales bacterium]|nr:MAG: SBBP repeat-containing protein [Ignavibacteriales bacterium]
MKFAILISIFSIATTIAQVTQEWVSRYNGPGNATDISRSIVVDKSGNVYVTGSSIGNVSIDFATIKYNPEGVQTWLQRYNEGVAYAMAIDSMGNVYVTGYSLEDTTHAYTTIKYNSDGVELWLKKYDGPGNNADYARAIAVDNQGNVYITGESYGGATVNYDYATVKYNSAGVEQWVKRYTGPGLSGDLVKAIAVDNDGNVYVTGVARDSGLNYAYTTIKYNTDGVEQWVRKYNGPDENGYDVARSIAVDDNGNVYVTGESPGSAANLDYATVKYNSNGVEQWAKRYQGPVNLNDVAYAISIDNNENIYVTGESSGSGTHFDFATIKYNSSGDELWVQRYNGPGNNEDQANAITIDDDGNVYVTGESYGSGSNYDYATIKYNSSGTVQWVQRYSGPSGIGHDRSNAIVVDSAANVYITGGSDGDYATIKYSQGLNITSPVAGQKWIAGETDTIKWTGGENGQLLDIEYSTDDGNTYSIIKLGVLAKDRRYPWKIPKNTLSKKVKIKLTDVINPLVSATSGTFKIKPYLLTRLTSNGDYDAYSITRDPYQFGNDSASVWPVEFWQNFNYYGTDPFTGSNYLLGVPALLLLQTSSSDHPDWVSWVRTFGVSSCYFNTSFPPVYSRTALLKWIDYSDEWGGSCFGLSTSNVLLFKNNAAFQSNYPSFPASNPIQIQPDDSVRTVINELYTHQFGVEHRAYRNAIGLLKTPNETLNDLKAMLLDDDPIVRTLSIVSNDPNDAGGHSIMAYRLEQDTTLPNIWYVFTYDNAYPDNLDSAIIIVDTIANTWTPIYAWTNWGGTETFYVRDPAINYLVNPSMPKYYSGNSPFILGENELQIFNTRNASIKITDQLGNSSGYENGILIDDIPTCIPNILENGSSSPPIGYDMTTADYSIHMNDYEEANASVSFYSGNKSFKVFRDDVLSLDNDRFFFDGGVSAVNPDQRDKSLNLLNIINETVLEKSFFLTELDLSQNDSVKIENPDSSKLSLISYGSAKDYNIELNYVTENGVGIFSASDIELTANTSHIFIPDWIDLTGSQLVVLIDVGNNGTIDDTLHLNNTVDVKDEGSLLSPKEFQLAQNYPNPFNPITTIQYSIPQRSNVVLKVYDVLGNEVAVLVNEEKYRGVYSVNFDASQYASGIYLYRIQAGSFVETKKMILIK